MRRAVWALIALLGCSIVLIACGGGYSSGSGNTTSGLTKKAFVSNVFTGAIDIVDAANDLLDTHRIISDGGPTIMSMSPDKTATLVFASGTNVLDVVANAQETVAGKLQLTNPSESFFYLPDNKHVYVAVTNSGTIIAWDTSSTSTPPTIIAPNVRFLVHSNNGKYVLGFPNDTSDRIFFVDTTLTTPPASATSVGGFDRPIFAAFSSDDTKAYVLNCGPECGSASATASIQVIDLPSLALDGPPVPVPGGATHALLNGTTLYVAGTPQPEPLCVANPASTCGRLSVVNVSGVPSVSASYEINDGFHDHMILTSNSRLYIGAEFTCNAVRPSGNGCLSIFNTSSNAVVIPVVCGASCNGLADVTGMTNISGRNIAYVVEGGEVHVYDTTTDALKPNVSLDTSGKSWDVVNPN